MSVAFRILIVPRMPFAHDTVGKCASGDRLVLDAPTMYISSRDECSHVAT
jgi:hypothetical protein